MPKSAAVGSVDLNVAGYDPVAQPGLKKGAAFVLTVTFGNDIKSFGSLQLATDAPGQVVFPGFAFAQIAEVGVNDDAVIRQRKTDRNI